MSPAMRIILLWLGFAGSHLTLSSLPVRRGLVARIGENAFRGLYSLVAFAFFGGFPLFAVVGAAHQDRRKLATDPRFRRFYDETPFLPFTGRSAVQGVRELVPTAAGLGILLAAIVRYFHGSWFGG